MSAVRRILSALSAGLVLLSGCSFNETSLAPEYSEQPFYSLCALGKPLLINNRGPFESRYGTGDLLLAGQITTQPLENWLDYHAVRLEYLPESGLLVTLIGPQGSEQSELLPAEWIHCADDALELEFPSDVFYVWASLGVKTRRVRLQVTTGSELVLHHLWEEKGMAAIVIPLKFRGDGWAYFEPYDSVIRQPGTEPVSVPRTGECDNLAGTYAVDGSSVRLDGSVAVRGAGAQFFRPGLIDEDQVPPEDWIAAGLQVAHAADGGIDLVLLHEDGRRINRRLEADRVSCQQGRWLVKGKKDHMPLFMLLTGSAGVTGEDLTLWRSRDGESPPIY